MRRGRARLLTGLDADRAAWAAHDPAAGPPSPACGLVQSLVLAAASGARTAAGLNRALAMEDAEALLATAGSAVA